MDTTLTLELPHSFTAEILRRLINQSEVQASRPNLAVAMVAVLKSFSAQHDLVSTARLSYSRRKNQHGLSVSIGIHIPMLSDIGEKLMQQLGPSPTEIEASGDRCTTTADTSTSPTEPR